MVIHHVDTSTITKEKYYLRQLDVLLENLDTSNDIIILTNILEKLEEG